jgi:hypothetical protein
MFHYPLHTSTLNVRLLVELPVVRRCRRRRFGPGGLQCDSDGCRFATSPFAPARFGMSFGWVDGCEQRKAGRFIRTKYVVHGYAFLAAFFARCPAGCGAEPCGAGELPSPYARNPQSVRGGSASWLNGRRIPPASNIFSKRTLSDLELIIWLSFAGCYLHIGSMIRP